MVRALHGVLRVEEDWLLTAGLPCGSFVWINRATSRRSRENPFGDQARQYIKNANKILSWCCLFHIFHVVPFCYI
jgi:hypothetical protein